MSFLTKREVSSPVSDVPIVTDAAALMETITRAARDPEIDVDKLERLMAMYERITSKQAEQAFNEALKEAQQEMPQVVKDADNTHTKSKYARLETLSKAVNPIITKHGFSMSFGTADCPEKDQTGLQVSRPAALVRCRLPKRRWEHLRAPENPGAQFNSYHRNLSRLPNARGTTPRKVQRGGT